MNREYDAVVVGSGPNGLAAAIRLAQKGLDVIIFEGHPQPGGGLRSMEVTLPGFTHDICAAVHPMAAGSPFLMALPLEEFGLEFLHPSYPVAHPFDRERAFVLHRSVDETIDSLGTDGEAYRQLVVTTLSDWGKIRDAVLGPLRLPDHPLELLRFGWKALQSAEDQSRRFFSRQARGLWAGMAAHSLLPLNKPFTSAFALMLLTLGHLYGWPVVRGGSVALANALVAYFRSLGGEIVTGTYISSLRQLPPTRVVLFDVTPRQLLQIAGYKFSSVYRWQLSRYRYGMGVFKVDWALAEPAPFRDEVCRQAATLHLGNTWEEIAATEKMTWNGSHPERPFVLYSQPTIIDSSRAPDGKHTAWAYCHVPLGSRKDMRQAIENQVERFAPGFKDRILARHSFHTGQLETYNPNLVGGDINGGAMILRQLFTRPAIRLSPYSTSTKGLYLCSSSTPPGGGAHGMCGYHAAGQALRDVFLDSQKNRIVL